MGFGVLVFVFHLEKPASYAADSGVTISGNEFLLNGTPFTPEGFISLALLDTQSYADGCTNPVTTAAEANFGPTELDNLKSKWHSNTVRIHVSQPVLAGTDGALYAQHAQTIIDQIRQAGLEVIVSMQDEPYACGLDEPLPSQQTEDAWTTLINNTSLKNDPYIMFEIMNEPQNTDNTAASTDPTIWNWPDWQNGGRQISSPDTPAPWPPYTPIGHQQLLNYMRENLGITNVIIADGAQFAATLEGLPPLTDPSGNNQIAYAVHALNPDDNQSEWETRFGNFAQTEPVIGDAWRCSLDTNGNLVPTTTNDFLSFMLNTAHVGVVAYLMDNFVGSAANLLTSDTALDPTACGQLFQQDYTNNFTSPLPLPTTPTNLVANVNNATSVSLTWDASTDAGGPGVGGYYLLRNGVQIANTNSLTTSFTDNTVAPNTQYGYEVEAYDTATPENISLTSSQVNVTTPAPVSNSTCTLPLYRLRNVRTGDHLYTTDINEMVAAITSDGYVPEGIAGYVDPTDNSGDIAIYRLRDTESGFHFYTTNVAEQSSLIATGDYVNEGITGYINGTSGSNQTPFYRLYDPNNGQHFYTASSSEEAAALKIGYISEGAIGYIYTAIPSTCHIPLYRSRNIRTGDHLYTTNYNELVSADLGADYIPEGISGYVDIADNSGDTPLYRLRQLNTGFHFYTVNSTEENNLVNSGAYVYEGIAGNVGSSSGTDLTPFFRLYNPTSGQHFYTASSSEETALIALSGGYVSEGNAGYVYEGE